MSEERNMRIRTRAHELWESEGRPDGREAEHWEQAEREISSSEKEQEASLGTPHSGLGSADSPLQGDAGSLTAAGGPGAPQNDDEPNNRGRTEQSRRAKGHKG